MPPPRRGDGAKLPSLEITHFVTGSVLYFVVLTAFHHLFTPPKTPSFPTSPASLLGVLRVFPHILLILEHKIRCFVVISMVFTGKVEASVFLTFIAISLSLGLVLDRTTMVLHKYTINNRSIKFW